MKKIYSFSAAGSFLFILLAFANSAFAQNITPIKVRQLTPQETSALDAKLQKRLPRQQACMELKQNVVKLVLWDCGVEDNDTVSINLNGQWILHKFRLTNAKQEMDITLAPGENQLTLLAENLGDLPDNTAAMSIKENGVEQKATLSSNLLTSGTLRLAVKGADPVTSAITGCPKETQLFMDYESQQVRSNPDLVNSQFGFLYKGIRKDVNDNNRAIEIQGCTNVSDSIVNLFFWDSGVEDGDTISVNVNGVWVVEKMRLSKQQQSVAVKLQPGSNYVILYAHNLGDLPNNTSGVGVEYKFGKQELGTLFSDMNTSGTFRFNCTAGADAVTASAPCLKTNRISARAQNDPEMKYLQQAANPHNPQNTQNNASNQPTQYNPNYNNQPVYNNTPANVAIGTGIGIIIGSQRNTGHQNSGSSGGNTGGGQHIPARRTPSTGTTPAPPPSNGGSNGGRPINY